MGRETARNMYSTDSNKKYCIAVHLVGYTWKELMSSLHLTHQPTNVYSRDGGTDKDEWTAKHWATANITYICVIIGFFHEVDEICTFWDITQHVVVIIHSQIVHL
jgi:hypothetical protein